MVTPATNQTGTATLTVRVSDGAITNAASFVLTVSGLNDPPVISNIADQSTLEDTPVGPIPFIVQDIETAASSLTLTASSSNPSLVATSNITFGGSSSNRTLTIVPQPNTSGTGVITVTVSDGAATASDTFVLVVTPVNDPPTLGAIADVRVNQNAGPRTVALTGISAGAGESNQVPAVTAVSADTNRIRIISVDYSGGATGLLTLQAVPGATGTGSVSVTVIDGDTVSNLMTRTFNVSINAAPSIGYVPDQETFENTSTGPIAFIVGDVESAPNQLTVHFSSSGPLFPQGSETFNGAGIQRSLTLSPAAGLVGTALATLSVTDPEGASSATSFFITVSHSNRPPVLDPVTNLLLNPASGPRAVLLTGIGPGATNEFEAVSVTARSSNSNVVAVVSVVSNTPSTATLTLLPGTSGGSAIVTVIVDDGQSINATTTNAFVVTLNTPPQISTITNRSTLEDVALTIPFTIGDAETSASSLSVTGYSSSLIIPAGNMAFSGSGSNRSLTLIGLTNAHGTAGITIAVGDSLGLVTSNSFSVVIQPVADPIQILTQPQSATVLPGSSVTLSCVADSTSTPHYQWRKNGIALSGATETSVVLTNIQPGDAGAYSCLVTNDDPSSVLSAVANLTVFGGSQLVSISRTGGVARLTYTTVAGTTNTVEFKLLVNGTNWNSLSSIVATGAVMTAPDPSATNSMRFYRVRTE
jgi:hypothetical protein